MIDVQEVYVVQTRCRGLDTWIDRESFPDEEAFDVADYLNVNGDDIEARVVRRWK